MCMFEFFVLPFSYEQLLHCVFRGQLTSSVRHEMATYALIHHVGVYIDSSNKIRHGTPASWDTGSTGTMEFFPNMRWDFSLRQRFS